MSIGMVAVAAGLVIALIVLIVIICGIIVGRKHRRNPYQTQEKSVFVKNGVDVKKQVLGGEKGEYFTGNLEKQGTYYMNPSVTVWRIVFDNLNTQERVYSDFTRQIWIGRADAGQGAEAKMSIFGDEKVSRNHCVIYESNGTLCLQDANSRNHTYLNGRELNGAVYLKNGDTIQVGNTQLRVQYSIISNRPA